MIYRAAQIHDRSDSDTVNSVESVGKRRLAVHSISFGLPKRTQSSGSLKGPLAASLLLHGSLALAAALAIRFHPGDVGQSELPVFEVHCVEAESVTSKSSELAEEAPPSPQREAQPSEPQIEKFHDGPHPEWTVEAVPLTRHPDDPVNEMLMASAERAFVVPNLEPESKPAPKTAKQQPQSKSASKAAKPAAAASSSGNLKTSPPRPLSPVAPAYPASAKAAGKKGTAWVLVVVKESGSLRSASINRSTGDRSMDAAALACVRRWKFAPGMARGVPVEASALVKVSFRLR